MLQDSFFFSFSIVFFYCATTTCMQHALPEMVSINSIVVQQNVKAKPSNHQGMECGHCPEKEITVTRRYCHSQLPMLCLR